nr:QWRF motif-containing protein 3 [Ipomoea batatas]
MEFEQSLKPRKPKFREVSSRFLSPTSNSSSANQINAMSSPNHVLSPVKQKPLSSTDSRKHKGLEKSGFMAKLWPSSAPSSSKVDTLGNHLGHERLKELEEDKNGDRADNNPMFLNRQNSCLEFSRFEREKDKGAKENHRPSGSMSMRYTGKFMLPGRSSTSSSSSSSSSSKSSNLLEDYSDRDRILPGRFSVDENTLQGKKRSDFLSDLQAYSESENTEFFSNNNFGSPVVGKNNIPSYMAPTLSSRKAGIEVPSKYMQDLPSKSRRWSSDSGAQNAAVSAEYSPKKASLKTAIKRTNSLGTNSSKCSASPGRSNSPPVLAENKGKLAGISTSKPPTSPSRVKGVGSFFSMGLELLKVKKSSSSSSASSPLGPGTSESVHHMRLFHNRLMQWRYANARSDVVNDNIIRQAKNNSIYAWDGLVKLHHSVMQKKLQLQKEKMEMKLTYVLHSQIKLLEAWGDMERQHLSAISMTKDSLNSVVCSVPLVQGAKVEPQSTSIALRHASDVAASIKLMLSAFSPGAEKTSEVLKEIAEVVTQEKLLLEECLELFKTISALEIQERSLKCNIVQLRLVEDEYQFQHQELSWKTYLQHSNNHYYYY